MNPPALYALRRTSCRNRLSPRSALNSHLSTLNFSLP